MNPWAEALQAWGEAQILAGQDVLQILHVSLVRFVEQIQAWHASEPVLTWCAFSGVFVALSAASLPGCSVLAVAAGALWGPWWGSLWVTLASALGAMFPFHMARAWGRERLQKRYPRQLERVDAGMARAGLRYLLLLRLVPVVPYTLVNPLMGLTPLRSWPFFAVSALGMWAGSAVYAWAGAGLWQWAQPGSLR